MTPNWYWIEWFDWEWNAYLYDKEWQIIWIDNWTNKTEIKDEEWEINHTKIMAHLTNEAKEKSQDIIKYNSYWLPDKDEKTLIDELEKEDPILFENLKWKFQFHKDHYLIKPQDWYQIKLFKEQLKWEKTIREALDLITEWYSIVTYSKKWIINWVDWHRYLKHDEVRYLHSLFKKSKEWVKFFLPLFLNLSNTQILSNMEVWDSKWVWILSLSDWNKDFGVHYSLNKIFEYDWKIDYSLLPVCTKETWHFHLNKSH